jgi:hypothetical protein
MELIWMRVERLGKKVAFDLEGKHGRWVIKAVRMDGLPAKHNSDGSYATKDDVVSAARAIAESIIKGGN